MYVLALASQRGCIWFYISGYIVSRLVELSVTHVGVDSWRVSSVASCCYSPPSFSLWFRLEFWQQTPCTHTLVMLKCLCQLWQSSSEKSPYSWTVEPNKNCIPMFDETFSSIGWRSAVSPQVFPSLHLFTLCSFSFPSLQTSES